ncbi:prolyl oligopeptidase family serine peptidase, partial [Gammaproteobacteria bacterium]|nr:prolyl oligopeptidase family serine peptidase [Gammaproteobacteria bacterium]
PAQVHDIKAALRFLRAKADEYGYDAEKITLWGYSSGGHLAALIGTTNGNAMLEGELGDYPDVSSDVQAIVDYSGPSNFQTILHQSTPHGVSVRAPALEKLLGRPVEDPAVQDMVVLASPVMQVSAADPPLLIMHGVQDNQVPINQSIELQDAYQKQGLHVEVQWIVEAQHTSGEYFESPYIEQVAAFLRKVL